MKATAISTLQPDPALHRAPSPAPAAAPGKLHLADRRCIACGRDKPGGEFAAVPLWPMALGGGFAPQLFHAGGFCASCAALGRQAIDGAFLKSWFMQSELARASQAFLDPALPAPAPLTYLGTARGFPAQEGEVCDRWSGLAGEQIYHVRSNEDSIWTGPVRGDIDSAATLPGERATLVLASPSAYWSHLALLSFAAHFPQAAKYCLNDFAPELTAGLAVAPFADLPHPAEIAFIRDKGGRGKVLNAGLAADGSQRFLIKLALGLGANLFGADFLDSASARQLRRAFWEPQPRARATEFPRDIATGPIVATDLSGARGALHLPGMWTLCLGLIENSFGLIVVTPNGRMLDIVVADDAALWRDAAFDRWRQPQVFVAIPQRGIFAEPVELADFTAHRDGEQRNPLLAALESLAIKPGTLPNKQGFA